MDIAHDAGEHHIGGTRPEGYGPSQMIYEPINVVCALAKRSKKLHLMGQSMGVASSYSTLTELAPHPEITSKIGNVVGISGYVGDTSEAPDGIWSGMKQNFSVTAAYEAGYMERVDLNAPRDGAWFAQQLKMVAAQNERMVIPPHVGNVLVYTPDDPLIAGPNRDENDSVKRYGPQSSRKLIVEDRTIPEEHRKKAHSMLWIAPPNIVRAVQAKVSEHGPHFVRFPKDNTGLVQKS